VHIVGFYYRNNGRISLLHHCDCWPLQLFLPATTQPFATVIIFHAVNAYSLNRQIRCMYTYNL